jgi:DNA-directed RNA polymerase
MYDEPYPKDGSKEDQAKWCQRREECWGRWYKQEQSRGRMLVRLNLAKNLLKWECFYHVYTLDFRGRAYTVCELLSPQASDFDRGLLMLAKGQKLTEEGRYWQKVNLANLFDQDKVSFDKRVEWVDNNWDMIKRIANNPYDNKEWVDNAVKKNKSFQRLAAIFDIVREDGYSYLHVYVDGKCNGNQHWSAIMKDPVIGKLTGVVPSDIPEDLYQYVADVTTDHCSRLKKENAWYETFLNHWKNRILRKVTKRSTMCEPYGLTFYGIQRYIKEEGHLDWVEPEKKGGAIVELARAIKSSLDSTLQEPNKGKSFLKSVTEKANELNKHLIWTTPSGFKVVHYYNKQQKRRSLSSLFNRKELVFYVRTDDVNPREALQAISPNFIHSLDAAHMFLTIKDLIEQGIYSLSMVHDSYGCRPNDVTIMQNNIRKTFVDIHKHNQLEVFKRQIEYQLGVKLPNVPDEGNMDIADVMQSKYFFA